MGTLGNRRPSPSLVVSFLALFVALSGTAIAVSKNSIKSQHIAKNAVRASDIKKNQILARHIRRNHVLSRHVKNGTLTAADINAATLGDLQGPAGSQGQTGAQGPQGPEGPPGAVGGAAGGDLTGSYPNPSIATGAVNSPKVANGSLTSDDLGSESVGIAELGPNSVISEDVIDNSLGSGDLGADSVGNSELGNNSVFSANVGDNSLTGSDVAENTLHVPSMGCQPGLIHGFARIKGSASLPSTDYTSSDTWIDRVYNCSGGSVSVRRDSAFTGRYFVRFADNPATIAFATPQWDTVAATADLDNIVTVAKGPHSGSGAPATDFIVRTVDADSGPQDGWFSILLP